MEFLEIFEMMGTYLNELGDITIKKPFSFEHGNF